MCWGQFLLHEDKKEASRSNDSSYDLLIAFLVNVIVVVITCVYLTPQWETNDDVAMAMIANGKGLVVEASSQLIFSNVVWGQAMRLSTLVFGYFGYSVGTFGSVAISGVVIYYTLRKSGCMHILCIAVITLISFRPLLLPQFTLGAGLSMIGALCLLHLFIRTQKLYFLVASCALAYMSYVIRSQEAVLVLVVALPTFVRRDIVCQRQILAAALCTVIAATGSSIADYASYQSADWRPFNEINLARAPYTDFGADALLKKRPDVYERHGFSSNDATMITGWGLYAVPDLATPDALRAMLTELGFEIIGVGAVRNLSLALVALTNPYLKFLLVSAILALILSKQRKPLFISWLIFMSLIIALGLSGRPAILRVYYPLLAWLLVAPMLSNVADTRQRLMSVILAAALVANTIFVLTQTGATRPTDESDLTDLKALNGEPLYVWGGQFPFETAFPPTRHLTLISHLKIYGFGVFTPAPFSVATRETLEGRSFEKQLLLPHGLFIMASAQDLDTLATYCQEHQRGELHVDRVGALDDHSIQKIRCVPSA